MGRDRLTELNDSSNPFASTKEASMDPVMSEFMSQSQECRTLLSQMETLIEEMKKLHKDFLTSDDDTGGDALLKQKVEDIVEITRQIRDFLKSLEENVQRAKSENETSTQYRIMKTQHFSLTNQFTELVNRSNMAQIDFRDKFRKQIRRQIEISGQQITVEEVEEILQSGEQGVFTQGVVMDRNKILSNVLDRHRGILELEKTMDQMGKMFNDLANCVEAQGEVLDSIAYNVENTTDFVSKARDNVTKALTYQRSARRKKIICVIILLVIIAIIVVILVVVLKKRK